MTEHRPHFTDYLPADLIGREPQTKAEVRAYDRADRRARWARRKLELRCFWTWPFGHAFRHSRCVNCGMGEPINL